MTRLQAIAMLIGFAETVAGEQGGPADVLEHHDWAVDALRVLGVTDVEVAAAMRKRERPGAWTP